MHGETVKEKKKHPILFVLNNNVNFVCFYKNIIQYFMTIGRI